jgi:RNA polymerase sigma factor (sigma-70 family)
MLEDKLLIWRFRQGSQEAFQAIYEKYLDDLMSLAMHLLHDRPTAEDVVHDVFVSFARGGQTFQLTGNLKSYLTTCIANRARDLFRKRQYQQTAALPDADCIAAAAEPGPVQLMVQNEELSRLSEALAQLPYDQREVIALRLHGGMKFHQIARQQAVSIKTAQSRYRYGLDKLRSLMQTEVTHETRG